MRVDAIAPCIRNVPPPQCRGPLELAQSHPAPRTQPWWRKGSGLTWLANGNDAANEQERISQRCQNQASAAGTPKLPRRAGSKKKKKLLCFSNGWFKAYETQSHSPAQQPQLETLQLERGSRAAREAARSPFHRTRAPGDAALSLGGAELAPGLSPVCSAEPHWGWGKSESATGLR